MIKTLVATALLMASSCTLAKEGAMFTPADFRQLQFLEGRWSGTGPDGKAFYEHYDFADDATFRSRRYAGPEFSAVLDSSSVTFKEGDIVSRWGPYSWRASEMVAGKACFTPIEAPSSFCWRRVDDGQVEVTQRWTGADGKPQTMAMMLKRIAPSSP